MGFSVLSGTMWRYRFSVFMDLQPDLTLERTPLCGSRPRLICLNINSHNLFHRPAGRSGLLISGSTKHTRGAPRVARGVPLPESREAQQRHRLAAAAPGDREVRGPSALSIYGPGRHGCGQDRGDGRLGRLAGAQLAANAPGGNAAVPKGTNRLRLYGIYA